ncbi:DNA segregation ATPase FtsK/SpoIIIE, S-DNA-T family [Streptomyces sp. 2112.3]|uniref:type VII secretion protein EccCa n=1 Tax=Streptomyces sp. 2112.3 TaxID=1881023 RepID=UPI000894FB99|nr:type VII secretion protein EccCa [Streptomyces sp. 2112.3]SED99507.1 DNA segregation ATPase FtsK/SpoIIIE, S-DNA-T family [Streptomyces sp. 2112.3]
MATVTIKRPPRATLPEYPKGELRLKAPPTLPQRQGESVVLMLLPMMGMVSSAVFFFLPGSPPFMKIMGGIMLISAVAMGAGQIVRAKRGSTSGVRAARQDYLKYLARTREVVRDTVRAQRLAECRAFPEPGQLWAVIAERKRLWERRPGDDDFAQVRVGVGPQALATPLAVPRPGPAEEWEPLSAHALQRFVKAYEYLDGLPLALSLRAFPRLTIRGDAETVQGSARAILCQLAALHSPDDLWIAVVAGPGAAREWDWIKWLPHARPSGHGNSGTQGGPGLLTYPTIDALVEGLAGPLAARPTWEPDARPLLDRPHVVILRDPEPTTPSCWPFDHAGLLGVTVIELESSAGTEQQLRIHGNRSLELDRRPGLVVEPHVFSLVSTMGSLYTGIPDALTEVEAVALARALAPLRASEDEDEDPLLGDLGFTDLMGIDDPTMFDPPSEQRSPRDRLRVPIGVDGEGNPVVLDLKEASQGGAGPHGLCVGATGSGKSELLRTLVLGLATTHGSETLNFILVDFKGGAAFAGLVDLPHVAAFISNLAEDLTLVDRLQDALAGELLRRQELLRSSGNFADIGAYERARAAGAPLQPLPTVLIVLDEFSELLAVRPEFIDTFLQIGRIGRSLGVHLLLASQRVEEGRLRGLDTYLSYRMVMRTFSAEESRIALGTPDAYHLPNVPGSALLSHGTEVPVQFKAAYVSGPHRPQQTWASGRRDALAPVLFTADVGLTDSDSPGVHHEADPQGDDGAGSSVLDILVGRLRDGGPPAQPVWLPPLGDSPALSDLLPALTRTAERGLHPAEWREMSLVVPLGIADIPYEQRREMLHYDFSGSQGHAAVVGGPRSGKSTLLRALVTSFALTHTPREVQFYCLDFGGGGLSLLADLPHVGGVASRLDAAKARRTIAEIRGILDEREEFFRAHHIDSIRTYRGRRAVGYYPDHVWGDVFLVIDGWGTFKRQYEQLIPDIEAIAMRGLAFGVHLVLSVGRYNEIRPALKDQLATRLELRMADPLDSEHDRKRARNVPTARPGHGLARGGLHYVAALPHADGFDSALEYSGGAADSAALIAVIASSWSGPVCPPVRMLPDRLHADALPKASETPDLGFAVGLDEAAYVPAYINFATDPILVIYGESESGKTALLRLLARRLAERHEPGEALAIVGDYRRALYGQLPQGHVLHYAPASASLEEGLNRLVPLLQARMPTADVTAEQMRAQSWWHGPEVFVIVDDYELVALPSGNPLEALTEYLPYARDIGLRVIVARSTAGAARTSFDPVTRRLKELGAAGIILSGDPDEGPLVGSAKAVVMPPGRAQFIASRQRPRLIQIGWYAPE